MVSYAALTEHSAVDAAMADFNKLGRELFLIKTGFPETSEGFVVTESGRYDVRALFAAAFELQHGQHLPPAQVAAGMRAASGAFSALGYVVLSADDQRKRTTHATFEQAVTALPIPAQNIDAINEFIRTQHYREFYVPQSRAYVGAKPRNGKPAHYIGRGSIVYREDDGRLRSVNLPQRFTPSGEVLTGAGTRKGTPRVPGSSAPREARTTRVNTKSTERAVTYCPTCFLALPATGACVNCD